VINQREKPQSVPISLTLRLLVIKILFQTKIDWMARDMAQVVEPFGSDENQNKLLKKGDAST
jgi:hypothetical protein